jgi:7,8-dihydro-6-hydroxymethylpterin-pyrophosphokinase
LLIRDFALQPLADIAPLWKYPVEGKRYNKTAAELLKKLPKNNLKKTELCLKLLQ